MPPEALLLGTVTHSNIDMPLRPRRGVGWHSEALEQILGSVSTLRDSSRSLATAFSFHAGYQQESNPTPLPPAPPQQWPTKLQTSATGVHLPWKSIKQDQNKQFQPQPLKCPGYLSPRATKLKERKLQAFLCWEASSHSPPLPQSLQSQCIGKRSLLPHQI